MLCEQLLSLPGFSRKFKGKFSENVLILRISSLGAAQEALLSEHTLMFLCYLCTTHIEVGLRGNSVS